MYVRKNGSKEGARTTVVLHMFQTITFFLGPPTGRQTNLTLLFGVQYSIFRPANCITAARRRYNHV
jgi:hypothetical protein